MRSTATTMSSEVRCRVRTLIGCPPGCRRGAEHRARVVGGRRPVAVEGRVEQVGGAPDPRPLLGVRRRELGGHLVRRRAGLVVDPAPLDLAGGQGPEAVHHGLLVAPLGVRRLGSPPELSGRGSVVGQQCGRTRPAPTVASQPREEHEQAGEQEGTDEQCHERREPRHPRRRAHRAVEETAEPAEQPLPEVLLVVLAVQELSAQQAAPLVTGGVERRAGGEHQRGWIPARLSSSTS